MQITGLKLGTTGVKDSAPGLAGMLTMLQMAPDGRQFYLLQPKNQKL